MRLLKKHFEGLDLDSPEATMLHGELIRGKKLLRHWYEIQYGKYIGLISAMPAGRHVELGSGGGFLKELCPFVTTSSLLPEHAGKIVDLCLDAENISLPEASVDSFFLLDILHHLRRPEAFFSEATRCLRPGGLIFIIEPSNTLFSQFIHKNFHHEVFNEKADCWGHSGKGHLLDSNLATPWIIFSRDSAVFMRKFPDLELKMLKNHSFLSYLLSGGLSYEQLLPAALVPVIDMIESVASPFINFFGIFMDILLIKHKPAARK
ncbi:MAG: class I SAM-dependent methyltransferase [bacterium]